MAAAATLIEKLEDICCLNGDDNCFYISEYERLTRSTSAIINNNKECVSTIRGRTVGFSEFYENVKMIANEMFFRHSIQPRKLPTPSAPSNEQQQLIPRQEYIDHVCSQCVLIVSDQPSVGEAAAVFACTRLRTIFVPVSLGGLHQTSRTRLQTIISEEIKPVAAIVVLSLPEVEDQAYNVGQEENDDDWETKPAFLSSNRNGIDVDSHPTITRLNQLGLHRIIPVSALDGSVLGPMAGLALGDTDLPVLEKEDDECDAMYILYTSGSTSKPKAVVQTYSGLLNRIQWQWNIFPFVQQMKRCQGYKETLDLLRKDGVVYNGDSIEINDDIVLRRTALSFVDSMAEIFGTLLGGASLFCPIYFDGVEYCKTGHGMGLIGMLDLAQRDKLRVTRMTCLPSQLSQAFRLYESNDNHSTCDWTHSVDTIIVSGEPCPLTLSSVFNHNVKKEKAILVNLYGQTETAGDVSCLVVASGNLDKPLSRYPNASKYIWDPSQTSCTGNRFIDNCMNLLVPCGFPVDGHNFILKPLSLLSDFEEKKKSYYQLSMLFVCGPGLALFYANNRAEMVENFATIEGLEDRKDHKNSIKPKILFNTMDLAFQNSNGMIFVVGRAPKNNDDTAADVENGNLCSLSMGKVSGVRIHAAEIEQAAVASLKKIVDLFNVSLEIYSSDVVAILSGDSSSETNKSFLFIEASRFLARANDMEKQTAISQESSVFLEASSIRLSSRLTFQDIVVALRSEIQCNYHQSIVPHYIHIISKFPTNGAAMKISKLDLARMAQSKLVPLSERESKKKIYEKVDPIQECIITLYASALRVRRGEIEEQFEASFAELGGDSMMAIDICHRILCNLRELNMSLSDDQKINPVEVLSLPLKIILEIIRNGREQVSPEKKKPRIIFQPSGAKYLELSNAATKFPLPIDNKKETCQVYKMWKVPLRMCVDSSPVIINNNTVVVGSQGGDVAALDEQTGNVLFRASLDGKIEGDLSCLFNTSNGSSETFVFIPTYNSNEKYKGVVYAFRVNKKELKLSWKYMFSGEIKGKPVAFIYPSTKDIGDGRLLCGSYDGTLTYFDAFRGTVLEQKDLRGAIHSEPVLLPNKCDGCLRAIVASCTWKGTVTCVRLSEDSIYPVWSIDLWAPVYSTPAVFLEMATSIAVCGVDGSIRSLSLENGIEHWNVSTTLNRPIFTKCYSFRDSVIFGSHDGKLRCISSSGNIRWEADAGSPILSSPMHIKDTIFFGDVAGRVHCLSPSDGSFQNRNPLSIGAEIFCSPVMSDEKSLYIGCRDSHLYKLAFK